MDNIILLKAWARLETFHKNLPRSDIAENYVAEYHDILRLLEQETGQTLEDFLIPSPHLERQLSAYVPPGFDNDFQEERIYSNSRYCKRAFFLMRLEAAMTFFRYLLPEEAKRRIGF